MAELKFPKNFLWGTSTSAYQVEGGIENDWSEWEKSADRINKLKKRGLNSDDFICGQACDSYHRYEEDFDLSVELNNNAIRFGLEWARINPREGEWDKKEIEHYIKVLKSAKARNLKVVATIWHWTNPIWFSEKGGWTNRKNIKHFLEYVKVVVENFGEYIDYWITLNEPMIHISNGYLTGKFPPNKKNLFSVRKVFNNLVETHNESYKIIHTKIPNAQVSITNLTNYFEPALKYHPQERMYSAIFDYFWNQRFLKKIIKHVDYIGVDYYFHDRIIWKAPFVKNKNEITTDMGWEIYPQGIYHVLKKLSKYNKPIIIMENGLADAEDKYRADFIKDHLKYVYQAIQEGADVRGYFYWSLLDNFEWASGFEPKFGLYKVNRETMERTARASAQVYAEICKNNSIKKVE
ncbi:MAG: glycoside hydrolase family 1 protein [bacterium]